MPQAKTMGTAWDRSLEDYAYAIGLDRPGWAWEFLRRNANYQYDFRTNRAGTPVPIQHHTGTVYYRPLRKFLAAERWGMTIFADPSKTELNTAVHWHPDTFYRQVSCVTKPANDNPQKAERLLHLAGRKHVLVAPQAEYFVVQSGAISVHLILRGASILIQDCAIDYQVEGLDRLSRVTETLQDLRRLRDQRQPPEPIWGQTELRLRECLIALDGHLAGRTYRDIAVVLYGSERAKDVWMNETRHLKDKVRRAVAAGIDYMNGGYLKLLQ